MVWEQRSSTIVMLTRFVIMLIMIIPIILTTDYDDHATVLIMFLPHTRFIILMIKLILMIVLMLTTLIMLTLLIMFMMLWEQRLPTIGIILTRPHTSH